MDPMGLKSRRCRLLREVFSALLLPPWFAGAGMDPGKEFVSACWEAKNVATRFNGGNKNGGVLTEDAEDGWEICTPNI